MLTDAYGTPYASKDEVSKGSMIQVDDGFSCVKRWSIHELQKDADGLFFYCKRGKHYIYGQLQDNGTYLGIYNVDKA